MHLLSLEEGCSPGGGRRRAAFNGMCDPGMGMSVTVMRGGVCLIIRYWVVVTGTDEESKATVANAKVGLPPPSLPTQPPTMHTRQ